MVLKVSGTANPQTKKLALLISGIVPTTGFGYKYTSSIYLVPELEISVASKSAAVTTVSAQGNKTFMPKTCQMLTNLLNFWFTVK